MVSISDIRGSRASRLTIFIEFPSKGMLNNLYCKDDGKLCVTNSKGKTHLIFNFQIQQDLPQLIQGVGLQGLKSHKAFVYSCQRQSSRKKNRFAGKRLNTIRRLLTSVCVFFNNGLAAEL